MHIFFIYSTCILQLHETADKTKASLAEVYLSTRSFSKLGQIGPNLSTRNATFNTQLEEGD